MIFKYKITNLKLFGYHGVYKEEKTGGQNFYFDIEFSSNYQSISDRIDSVIDYSSVCEDIKYVFNKKKYNLLETLLTDITSFLNNKYNIDFKVTVKKESHYMTANLDNISIEL